MPVDQKVRAAVDLDELRKELAFPPEFKVVELRVEDYVTYDGDDALRINVILADETNEDQLDGQTVMDLRRAIQDRLAAIGVHLFPFIYLRKVTEPTDEAEGEEKCMKT
jgi:hypothetical protein